MHTRTLTNLPACTYSEVRAAKKQLFYDVKENRDAKNLQERKKYAEDQDMQARKERNRYRTERAVNCA